MTPQELKSLLTEVTQGDWVVDPLNAGIADVQRDANARLIAMAPAIARRVIAAEKLVEALRWYSDECNYIDTPSWDGNPEVYTAKAIPVDTYDGAQYCDQGDRARAALAEWEAAQ